jgi:transposase InsO family protein
VRSEDADTFCIDCQKGKAHEQQGHKGTRQRATEFGRKFHIDLFGPVATQSKRANKYFIGFTDDHTGFTYVIFIRLKSEFYDKFVALDRAIFNERGYHINTYRTDNAKEIICNKMSVYCQTNGIIPDLTNTYSSWENGVAERKNRTLLESARCMIFAALKPKNLWEDAVDTSCYVRNRSPSRMEDAI